MYTRDGVSISVSGVAQVKIEAQVEEMLRNALQQFLGKTPSQVRRRGGAKGAAVNPVCALLYV